MFTGIIEKLGLIAGAERTPGGLRLQIQTGFPDLALGESVAVNGACLTVAEPSANGAAFFFVSPETLDRTSLGRLKAGAEVNLERALALGGRLSGHWVQGHIDGVGRLKSAQAGTGSETAVQAVFELPAGLARDCVEKGSIALDGVSLTVNRVDGREIAVTLIPHTWKSTNLSRLAPGDAVNVETDILAKYVRNLCRT